MSNSSELCRISHLLWWTSPRPSQEISGLRDAVTALVWSCLANSWGSCAAGTGQKSDESRRRAQIKTTLGPWMEMKQELGCCGLDEMRRTWEETFMMRNFHYHLVAVDFLKSLCSTWIKTLQHLKVACSSAQISAALSKSVSSGHNCIQLGIFRSCLSSPSQCLVSLRCDIFSLAEEFLRTGSLMWHLGPCCRTFKSSQALRRTKMPFSGGFWSWARCSVRANPRDVRVLCRGN